MELDSIVPRVHDLTRRIRQSLVPSVGEIALGIEDGATTLAGLVSRPA